MGDRVLEIRGLLNSCLTLFHLVLQDMKPRILLVRIAAYTTVLLASALLQRYAASCSAVNILNILFFAFSIWPLWVNIWLWNILSPRFFFVWCFDYCRFVINVPSFSENKKRNTYNASFCLRFLFFCSWYTFVVYLFLSIDLVFCFCLFTLAGATGAILVYFYLSVSNQHT